jgi:pentatricopeptide repeat protein
MLELLRDRLESGQQQGLLLADQISFGTVLAACSRLHHWALAVELVQLMQTSRLTPDVVPLCSAAAACNRAAASSISGAWRWSLYFFSLARWAGQTPNLTLHNCAISAVSQVSKHGNWALAMQKLQAGGGQFLKPMATNGPCMIDGGVWRPKWPFFLQFKSCSLQKWNLPLHWVLAFLGSSSGP